MNIFVVVELQGRFYLNDNEDDDEEFVFALIIAGALDTFTGILRFLFKIDVKDNRAFVCGALKFEQFKSPHLWG